MAAAAYWARNQANMSSGLSKVATGSLRILVVAFTWVLDGDE